MGSSSPNFRGENKKYLKSPPSHYLQGFLWIPGGCLGFFHQPYDGAESEFL